MPFRKTEHFYIATVKKVVLQSRLGFDQILFNCTGCAWAFAWYGFLCLYVTRHLIN